MWETDQKRKSDRKGKKGVEVKSERERAEQIRKEKL